VSPHLDAGEQMKAAIIGQTLIPPIN